MFIARALQRPKGNVGDAAELLGLHRNTLARKMAEYRIKRSKLAVAWPPTLQLSRHRPPRLAVPLTDCLTTPAPSV